MLFWLILLYRKIRYGYPFRKIQLTHGKFAIVDVEDFERLNRYKWMFIRGYSGYAGRTEYLGKGKNKMILMHRKIMAAEQGILVDHINHNGLDNRKINLRFATYSQNNSNKRTLKNLGTSKYRGVQWRRQQNKWMAMIKYNKKRKFLGYYTDERKAAKAYNEAAKIYHGQFASPNEDV